MSKKILVLFIIFLIGIPAVVYLLSSKSTPDQVLETQTSFSSLNEEIKNQQPQTTLAFSPNPQTIASQSGSINIVIDTGTNAVTAVQLELSYDPAVIQSIDIAPGTFFPDAIVFLKNINTTTGKISYVLAISPTGKAKMGNGAVATINFTTNPAGGGQTQITFTQKTLVTAEGVQTSVLKTSTPGTIIYP